MRERKYTVRFTEDEAEWLQEVALDGNVSGYIRDAVLRQSKSDLKLVNMTDQLVYLGQEMRVVTGLLNDIEGRISDKLVEPRETTGSGEDGGIPDELMGMVLEILLLTRSFSHLQDRKMAQADVAQIGLPIWRKA